MTGIITNIQHYSVHDGPGIRTTVFMKGCQLACKWCCNPETQGDAKVTSGDFAPSGQKYFYGHEILVDDLVEILMKDRLFYDKSGGGVTISGGDPMYQPDFTYALCEKLQQQGIHICMDTYGHCAWETIRLFQRVVDLWLYDIKSLNEERHKEYTGVSCKQAMRNLMYLDIGKANIKLRIAVIPDFNDNRADMWNIIRFIKTLRPHDISMFPYHAYGAQKYKRLGREYEMPLECLTDEDIQWAVDLFERENLKVEVGS